MQSLDSICPCLPQPLNSEQATCRFAAELAAAAQRANSQGAVLQATRLVLLGAQRASSAGDGGGDGDSGGTSKEQQPKQEESEALAAAGTAAARNVAPAASFLSALMLQAAPASAAGKSARAAWAALLDGLRPAPLRLAALRALLASAHPEICALLLARARQDAAAGAIGVDDCWQLCAPWLLPDGPRGWRGGGSGSGEGEEGVEEGALPANANAVCAALNLLRLVLLRRQSQQRPEAGAAAAAGGAPAGDAGLPAAPGELAALLAPLAAAVQAGLARARAEAGGGGGDDGGGGDGKEDDKKSGATDDATAAAAVATVPGEARGSGSAVDAWLALSRVDEVLGRVLELC